MEQKPSLSQYFGSSEVPPASQFFDEIGTSPSDMIQSVYLGDSESVQTTTSNLFPQSMTASFAQHRLDQDTVLTNILPTVSGSAAVSAASLPDPSTFFDNIGPEPPMGLVKPVVSTTNTITEAIEGLAIKNQPVDKAADRRRDAWIPNDEAKKTLMKAQSSPKGAFFPERDALTMPGLVLEDELPDQLHEVCVGYLGVGAAGRSGVWRADHVTADEAGLHTLVTSGCLRAAINLTATLITVAQQGRMHRPSKHSARTLQVWLTRFALMLRVRIHEALVSEAEAFGDFGKPDMYYQFYPDSHGARSGSLVPFSLRLLVAELPSHVGKPEEALDRLYAMLDVVQKMLSNLRAGRTEDGSDVISCDDDRRESLATWTARETRLRHSIVNCAIAMKEYRLASTVLTSLSTTASSPIHRRLYTSSLCRLWLQAGHVDNAAKYAELSAELQAMICAGADVRDLVDRGLLLAARGDHQQAYNHFASAAQHQPTNIMVANNLSVCLLYMGKLNEAIQVLQKAINADPERGLNESLLLNLCTLYELESSKTQEKKINLLRMLCKYKSDTFPNVLECLKLS